MQQYKKNLKGNKEMIKKNLRKRTNLNIPIKKSTFKSKLFSNQNNFITKGNITLALHFIEIQSSYNHAIKFRLASGRASGHKKPPKPTMIKLNESAKVTRAE